jgi:hypothetical protein
MAGSTIYDTATDLKTLLNDNWNGSALPDITFTWEERSTGFMDDRRDFVLITPTNENPQYFGLYGEDFLHEVFINLQIHTFQNIEHNQNIVNEVFRIIKANIRRTNYVDLILISSSNDNDLYRNIYRHNITVRYRKLNP